MIKPFKVVMHSNAMFLPLWVIPRSQMRRMGTDLMGLSWAVQTQLQIHTESGWWPPLPVTNAVDKRMWQTIQLWHCLTLWAYVQSLLQRVTASHSCLCSGSSAALMVGNGHAAFDCYMQIAGGSRFHQHPSLQYPGTMLGPSADKSPLQWALLCTPSDAC